MPTYNAITTTLHQLPTHNHYIIQINNSLPLHSGQRIDAEELRHTVIERLKTWLNPLNCKIEVVLAESQQMTVHKPVARKGKGGAKGGKSPS
eukprot:4511392-Karenia_brevis.AAC.1